MNKDLDLTNAFWACWTEQKENCYLDGQFTFSLIWSELGVGFLKVRVAEQESERKTIETESLKSRWKNYTAISDPNKETFWAVS